MVDSLARHRLAERDWKAPLPSSRDPAMMAARSVMRALGGLDPLIGGSGVAHPDELAALAARFERHERRLRGEPVVLPRVRLVVPDDPYDDWDVRLELVDEVDPGRWCSAEDVWDVSPSPSRSPAAPTTWPGWRPRSSTLATTVAECVDVAADLAREHEPVGLELSVEDAERFLEQAPAELAARGIELVGPERLVRAGVRVSGRATPHDAAGPPEALRARGRRRRGSSSSPTTTARRRSPTPSSSAPSGPAPRCCTAAGGGCASTRRRCAGPASCSRSRSASTPSSTPSRC